MAGARGGDIVCRMGVRRVVVQGEWETKPTQRVKMTRWVVVGVVAEGCQARKPPNVSE